MENDQPSRTAENAAIVRAIHQHLPAGSRVLDDPIAIRLVDPASDAYRTRVRFLANLPHSVRPRWTHYMLRSRYAEDCLAESVQQRDLRQYVILGAGLDTFAYRQPAWASQLSIFEVDHPATQNWKHRRLDEASIDIPGNVRWVPIDFDELSLDEGLLRAAFDQRSPTFFSMLGVSQYLTPQALDDTLRFVASMPRSSEIVFSIAPPEDLLPAEDAAHIATFTKHVATIGEPWLTRPRPAELVAKLRDTGFSVVHHMAPEEANARYFLNRRDDLKASVIEQMIRAIV